VLRLSIVTAAACFTIGCATEAESSASPSPALELTGRVVDTAEIISAEVEVQLADRLEFLEKDTGVQLVVATAPSLDGREIDTYSLDLAKAWGIGSAERDDGLLLLVAPNERKVRIEVGLGLEASVNNEEAAKIIYDDIIPHFREGDYEAGITAGVDSLIREVAPGRSRKAA
jgi:uncharacterized protein